MPDGSFFHEKIGAAAWILSSADGRQWIAGGSTISGPAEVQSAYTNTAAVDFLSNIKLPTVQPVVPITAALDGKGALNMCTRERE